MRRCRAQPPIQEQHSRRRKKNEQVQQRGRMNMYNKEEDEEEEEGRKSSNASVDDELFSGFNEPSVLKSLKNGMRHYQRNNGNNQ
ncbi:unnamed protein product [Sphagnum balticum]